MTGTTAPSAPSPQTLKKEDLDEAASVFELAGDGTDEDMWAMKFQSHMTNALMKHGKNLRPDASAAEQNMEILRARAEIHEVVLERIMARAARVDDGLGHVLTRFRDLHLPVVRQALEPKVAGGRSLAATKANQLGDLPGAAAFAAAATARRTRPNSPASSPLAISSPDRGPTSRGEMSPGSDLSPKMLLSPCSMPSAANKSYTKIHVARQALHGANVCPGAHQPAKELPLRELREYIMAIYASKMEHDHVARSSDTPRQTLEQHLYLFLGRRYSLKTVVREWAQSIFRSVAKYSDEVDVLAFGKMLQNRISEGYQSVQENLLAKVQELLRSSFDKQYPQRPAAEVDKLWTEYARSGVLISDCEAAGQSLYSEADYDEFMARLNALPKIPSKGKGKDKDKDKDASSAPTVRYKDFLNMLLKFQMNLAEGFLADFVAIFQRFDSNADGVLDAKEIEGFVNALTMPDGEESWDLIDQGLRSRLEAMADEAHAKFGGWQQATFSDCADSLSEVISARWEVSMAAWDKCDAAANAADAPEGKTMDALDAGAASADDGA